MSQQARLIVNDDLERWRLTVFFRFFMTIPHLIWLALWGSAVAIMVVINWFATLFRGEPLATINEIVSRYIRAVVHVNAFLFLAADPYPPFLGEPGRYPIDVELPPLAPQNRWITGFRWLLAIPAAFFNTALFGSGGARSNGYNFSFGVALAAGFLGWWASLVRGRMPRGLRDAITYSIAYTAQLDCYTLLLTDKYPDADPVAAIGVHEHPHPVRMTVTDDLARSRLTVFFRLLLAIPHFVWLALWSIAAYVVAILSWFAALFTGYTPEPFHRFLTRYVRYTMHVVAFLYLTANPFPGFTGLPGTYPVDVEIAPRERQNRWITGFRVILAFPAFLIAGSYATIAQLSAVFIWFTGLFTARAPRGLRNASAIALRYSAQTSAYFLLLTDQYPYAGPTDPALAVPEVAPATPDPAPVPAPV